MKKIKYLRCSCCGYIPTKRDIIKYNYHLTKCDQCGEYACSACVTTPLDIETKTTSGVWTCNDCNGLKDDGFKVLKIIEKLFKLFK